MQTIALPEPLAEARQLIDSGKYRILSLDIFDTTVWRTFPTPSDLFYALGQKLLNKGTFYSSASAASFVTERVEAERQSREQWGQNGEVTLAEIYRCFPRGYLRQGTIDDMIAEELALERQSTFADVEIVALIDYASAHRLQIAFVSDTYFEQQHLQSILPRTAAYLIASSFFRRPKVQGLHTELLNRAKVRAGAVLHIGDNYDADVTGPSKLGVKTLWRPRFPQPLEAAVRAELPATRTERAAYFGSVAGDAGLNAVRAQAVTLQSNWEDPLRSWGALFLGPVIAGFGKWVGERCHAEGITAALCLMREGKILKRVLDGGGTGLRADEFYTSRFALIKASIFSGEIAEFGRYLARPNPTQVQELLGPLRIECSEIGLNPDDQISASNAHRVADRIANTPAARKKAVEASAAARHNFLVYLKAKFPDLPQRVAVVDLGYSGTIQNCLQEIFDHEGIACRTHGLYFVTGGGIRKLQAKGTSAEGFLAENGQPLAIAHSFMRSPELIEQCLMCSLGSTVGYSEAGVPELGVQHLPELQLTEIERVQTGLMSFTDLFTQSATLRAADTALLRPFLENILVRALTMPVPAELKSFGHWVHDENFGSSRTRGLIDTDLDPQYLHHASVHQLASLANNVSYWIFGAARNHHPVVGEAVRSVFLRKTEPEAFQCPEEQRILYFFWNDGEAHRADATYQLSSRRTAWNRFTLEVRQANLLEVGFSFGAPGDVIQVSGIVLRLQRPGRPVEIIRQPLSDLKTFGLESLHGSQTAYLVKETAGVVSAVDSIRDFTGTVQIDLLFAHMPTGELCLS
ncbi:MAG: hypothetical protein ABI824_07055 [Acidobacteriota bacterium]